VSVGPPLLLVEEPPPVPLLLDEELPPVPLLLLDEALPPVPLLADVLLLDEALPPVPLLVELLPPVPVLVVPAGELLHAAIGIRRNGSGASGERMRTSRRYHGRGA
jgi:hypothetical protein